MTSVGTFAGMVLAVNLLTQATKTFFSFATRWLVLLYAFIVQAAIIAIAGNFTAAVIFLGIINSVLVAMTAIGAYQVVDDKGMTTSK
jgi:hypothetical protein